MTNFNACDRVVKNIDGIINSELFLKCVCNLALHMYLRTNTMSYDEIYKMFADVIYSDEPDESQVYRLMRFVEDMYSWAQPMIANIETK